MNRQKSYGNTHSCNFCAGACSYSSIVDVCPCYIYDICPLLLGNICEHCWIFKYVACRRPSEFHQSKRVVPQCGQILVFGLSTAASQPRSRSGQRTQSFHHSYLSMFNVLYSMYNVQCSVDAQFSILKIRPTHTIVPSLVLYHT